MRQLAIFGASGHGRVVADTAQECGWQQIDFFDDRWPNLKEFGPWKVNGDQSSLMERLGEYPGVIVAVGDNLTRARLQTKLEAAGAAVATIIHPAAVISRYAALGTGSVVCAGVVVNAGVAVGRGVILNTGCSVDHDCALGEFVHISPGARLAGNVVVGVCSWVGIGAAVRQGIQIGSNAVVGAGAVVIDDVAPASTVVGVPARLIHQ